MNIFILSKDILTHLLCIFVIAFLSNASAYETGNELYQDCISNDVSAKGICLGYIEGVRLGYDLGRVHGYMKYHSPGDVYSTPHCAPESGTKGQMMDVIIKYLKNNPKIRHKRATDLVHNAFKQAFPCH